mmetsp:Transcript_23851/g.46761  ORF Transcript_23851/g.46761 Transcript_23851/m.46761 type:complete len:472 (-) Transcript_23851:115-1530(-)
MEALNPSSSARKTSPEKVCQFCGTLVDRSKDRLRHMLESCIGTENVPEALQNCWEYYRMTLRKQLKDELKSKRDGCSDSEKKRGIKRIALRDIQDKSLADNLKKLTRLAFVNTSNHRNPDDPEPDAKRLKSRDSDPSPPSRRDPEVFVHNRMKLVTHTSGTIGKYEFCKLLADKEVVAWAKSVNVEVKREWDGPEPTSGENAFFMEVGLEAKGGDAYRVLFCNAQNIDERNLRERIWGFLYPGRSPETCLLRFKPTKRDVNLPDSAIKFTLSRNPNDGYQTVFIGNFPAKGIEGGKVQVACNKSWIKRIMAPMFKLVRKYVDRVDKDVLRVPKSTMEYQFRDAGCLSREQLVEEVNTSEVCNIHVASSNTPSSTASTMTEGFVVLPATRLCRPKPKLLPQAELDGGGEGKMDGSAASDLGPRSVLSADLPSPLRWSLPLDLLSPLDNSGSGGDQTALAKAFGDDSFGIAYE